MPILKLVERQGNQQEKLLNAEISNLIGRRLHDFDVMGAEVGLISTFCKPSFPPMGVPAARMGRKMGLQIQF